MVPVGDILKSLVVYFKPKDGCFVEDYRLSAVHYKIAFGTLLACCLLSGLTSWYSSMQCTLPENQSVTKEYVREICYANATFITLRDPATSENGKFNSQVVRLSYYQWVTLVLVLQAACFQIPRVLWKSLENGAVQGFVEPLKNLQNEPDKKAKIDAVADDFLDATRLYHNRMYFSYFAAYQILYFVNSLAQIVFTEAFLRGQFIGFLPSWVQGTPGYETVFPKVAQCTFQTSGAAGGTQIDNVICVLAMNVLIEKIYLVLWVLFALTLAASIAQILTLIKYLLMEEATPAYWEQKVRRDRKEEENLVMPGKSICLILSFIQKNVDPVVYASFLESMENDRVYSV